MIEFTVADYIDTEAIEPEPFGTVIDYMTSDKERLDIAKQMMIGYAMFKDSRVKREFVERAAYCTQSIRTRNFHDSVLLAFIAEERYGVGVYFGEDGTTMTTDIHTAGLLANSHHQVQ